MKKSIYRTLISFLAFITIFSNCNKVGDKRIIKYYNEKYLYASCDDKNIYIVKDIAAIQYIDASDNNVIIIDGRNNENPDMQVIDSNKIESKDEMEGILEILLHYEEEYPSKWNRSNNSMKSEWRIHNTISNLDLLHNHTDSVDLDNEDEELYDSAILKLFIK